MRFDKFVSIIKQIISLVKSKIKKSPLYGRTLMIFFLVVFVVKIFVVYLSYRHLDPVQSCLSYISSDVIILFFAHLLITINSRIKTRWLRLFNDIIVFIILMVYCVDIFIIFFFQSRVSISEAFMLWSNWSVGFAGAVRTRTLIFLIVGFLAFLLVQSRKRNIKWEWKKMTIVFSVCSILYAIFYLILSFLNINVEYVDNILSINFKSINNAITNMESDNHKLIYDDYMFNVQWEWKDLNVILVFAESLSAIDSLNVWWNNKIPYFDKIQNNWINYTNFITNWTTSDTAHISTLYWVIPLINMGANNTPYSWYKLLMQPLPEYLNTQWYNTIFVSAASLDFLDQRAFLSWAWFQKIIWEEAFTDSKMYAFESAPDGDLYDRVLQEVQSQTGKYFIWLQTISFHKPYNTPNGKTEDLALQYADEELYRFYQELQKIWFFDDWILVIVWDHRKMNPAEEWERELFWKNRYTKSVATVVWSWIQAWTVNNNIIQHTDFYNSLKVLLWHWAVKIDKIYNDTFSNKVQRDRWITNAEFYEINRYAISSINWETILFRNLSNLLWKNDEVYNYFSSYLWFEFWNDRVYKDDEDDSSIKLIWHRWSIDDSPENTLQSFLSAKEKWASWIEFDVSYTRDKQNIVVHWDELYASNCTKLKVWDYTLDRITKNCTIINWEKYKTLKEMLEMIDGLFDYYILEIKVYDESLWIEQTQDIIQTVRDLNMLDRVIFISYSDSARAILNSQTDVIFWWDTFDINDLDFIWDNNSEYFLAPYDLLTQEVVDKAKSLWKEVMTYTVNDPKNYQSMKDLWINIIMTDKLDLLQEYDNNKYYPIRYSLENINLQKSSR
jgi:glycerophosphoryl diester phosphodiesterase